MNKDGGAKGKDWNRYLPNEPLINPRFNPAPVEADKEGMYDLVNTLSIGGRIKFKAELNSLSAAKVIALLAQIENMGTGEVKVTLKDR